MIADSLLKLFCLQTVEMINFWLKEIIAIRTIKRKHSRRQLV
jgi:hypothetical protein